MKLTPWFDGSVKPARSGVYEREGCAYILDGFAYFDGVYWRNGGCLKVESARQERGRSSWQVGGKFNWRGLAQDPKAKP